jgi:hypothetical protein
VPPKNLEPPFVGEPGEEIKASLVLRFYREVAI